MNCRVSADFPTPPLPTMMTLWTIGCVGAFLVAIFFCAIDWPPPPPPPLLLLVREAKTLPLLLLLLASWRWRLSGAFVPTSVAAAAAVVVDVVGLQQRLLFASPAGHDCDESPAPRKHALNSAIATRNDEPSPSDLWRWLAFLTSGRAIFLIATHAKYCRNEDDTARNKTHPHKQKTKQNNNRIDRVAG